MLDLHAVLDYVKTALVTAAIDAFPGNFTLTDLERACPGVSRDMVRPRSMRPSAPPSSSARCRFTRTRPHVH